MRVCLAIFRFLFLNSLRLFNFIHACVPLITPAIETRPSFFAVSFICVFRCEKFGPGDEASSNQNSGTIVVDSVSYTNA